MPDRINNLSPTIQSLLKQTRPLNEIVLASRNFRFVNNGLTRYQKMFRVGRDCVFFIVAGIGDRPRNLFPSFAKSWRLAGEIHCMKRYAVPASAMIRSVWRQRRTFSLHNVPNGRQYHNNETIAFFKDNWDVFDSD